MKFITDIAKVFPGSAVKLIRAQHNRTENMKIEYDGTNPYSQKYEDLGTITLDDGTIVWPTKQAELGGTNEEPKYFAPAVNVEGDIDYRVYWDCVDGWETHDDATTHCDWDNFIVDKA